VAQFLKHFKEQLWNSYNTLWCW